MFPVNLQIRLLGIFLITVFTAVLLTGINAYKTSQGILSDQLEKTLEKSSSGLQTTIAWRLSEALAAIDGLKSESYLQNPEKTGYLFRKFITHSRLFHNIFITDTEGKVIEAFYADERDSELYRGENLLKDEKSPFSQTAEQVLKDGKSRFSPLFRDKKDQPIITCVAAISHGEQFVGLISAAIRVNAPYLQNWLELMKPSDDGFALLKSDGDGVIFAFTPSLPQELQKVEGEIFAESAQKKNYLLREKQIDIAEVSVMVGIKKAGFYQPLKKQGFRILTGIIISLLFCAIVGLWLSNSIARPLLLLVNGLKSAGEGVYSIRIECQADQEIGETLSAFNDLMEKLQKQRLIEKLWNERWDV
jgi:HAMP domain-containing protein